MLINNASAADRAPAQRRALAMQADRPTVARLIRAGGPAGEMPSAGEPVNSPRQSLIRPSLCHPPPLPRRLVRPLFARMRHCLLSQQNALRLQTPL